MTEAGTANPSPRAAWRIVGRQREQAILEAALEDLDRGVGGLLLVAGEAGGGKTTLVESALASADAEVLRGGAHVNGAPYEPLTDALRDHLRGSPAGAVRELASSPSLGLVLEELGPTPPAVSAEHVPAAIRGAFERLTRQRSVVVFLDDLQWADAATLHVLADWIAVRPGLPLLVIGAYRSDELSRRHPLRGLRSALRRAHDGGRRHVHLGPFDLEDTETVVRRILGDDVTPELVGTVHRRGHGLPFYVEELAASVADVGVDTAVSLVDVVPETVRDAVLHRVAGLSESTRTVAEIAAAGAPVPVGVLTDLANEDAVEEVLELGLLVELPRHVSGSTDAAFRHALVGEALYAATPWTRRRRHHAALARALEARGGSPAVVAAHWDRAHQAERARPWLLAAAEAACSVHAYRDARNAIGRALALWPPGEDVGGRLLAIDRLGGCAARCGELDEAIHAWEEVATARRSAKDQEGLADVQRRLAGVYELTDDWPRALQARMEAAAGFARTGLDIDAATERLAAAAHLESAGDLVGALRLVQQARAEIEAAADGAPASGVGPAGLRARAMGLEGHVRACLGEGAAGVELTRRALDLVLGSDLDALAADVYSLHAYALEQATDYAAGLDTLANAVTFCRTRGLDRDAHVCLACLTPALRHTGQWGRALEVGREVLATHDAPEVARMVAAGEVGLVLANQGRAAEARRHLAHAAAFSRVAEVFGLEIETSWGLARVHELDGDDSGATARLRELCARCLALDERHYAVAALRWASTYFGRRGLHADLGACTNALARIASATGTAEATGALAHALGEGALLEGDARRAADQFERTLELLVPVGLPPETAETQVRAGVALADAGDRSRAVERLVGAYHTARTLGARPLAAAAVGALESLGEDVERRLGRDATRQGDAVDLTRREREVLGLLATGLTNRAIAGELFLSPRTVDMHVRNLLAKLDCHTRTEAVRRAGELGLLQVAAR